MADFEHKSVTQVSVTLVSKTYIAAFEDCDTVV